MRAAIGAVIFGVILMLVTAGQRTGADYNNGPRGDYKATETPKREKSDATTTEWLADPQRGWIRVEQRPQKDRENPRNKNSDRKANTWEY